MSENESAPDRDTVQIWLSQLLQMHRAGASGMAIWRKLPPEAQDFFAPKLRVARLALGAELGDLQNDRALLPFVRWTISQLRPDHAPSLRIADKQNYLDRPSWRPMIVVMCHYAFAAVTPYAERYLSPRGESPIEHLCGLWNIGINSVYRYLESGTQRLAAFLCELSCDGDMLSSLRDFIWSEVADQKRWRAVELAQWQTEQAQLFLQRAQPLGAVWHARAANDMALTARVMTQHALDLSNESFFTCELNRYLTDLQSSAFSMRERVVLGGALAGIYRIQQDNAAELDVYQKLLHVAAQQNDALSLALVHLYLGKYEERRDADRSLAHYQDAVDLLAHTHDDEFAQDHLTALVRLAWLYIVRNDPRALPLLQRADQLRQTYAPRVPSSPTFAMLEQAWAEYQRRASDFASSLEHTNRALNIYEQLGDMQGKLKSMINLVIALMELKQFDRAIEYSHQSLALIQHAKVDPEHEASVYLNLGTVYFWKEDYDTAIDNYQNALRCAERANMKLHIGRVHYNLAEAHYIRYLRNHSADDEHLGDDHVMAVIHAAGSANAPLLIENARNLKTKILSGTKRADENRLINPERAAHPVEAGELDHARLALEADLPPAERIHALLRISKIYQQLSAKEREHALRLCQQHDLVNEFRGEFDALREVFERSESRDTALVRQWCATGADEAHARKIIEHFSAQRSINKSAYAALCSVSAATASKHLNQYLQWGLVRQIGNGPSTRYELAEAVN